MLGRHPAILAFALTFAAGAAFVLLGISGPDWLLVLLTFVFFKLFNVGVGFLLAGWVGAIRRWRFAGRAMTIGAAWVGFPAGFYLVGLMTCAFCLD